MFLGSPNVRNGMMCMRPSRTAGLDCTNGLSMCFSSTCSLLPSSSSSMGTPWERREFEVTAVKTQESFVLCVTTPSEKQLNIAKPYLLS